MRKILMGAAVALTCTLSAIPHYIEFDGNWFDYRQGGGAQAWVPICGDGTNILFGQARIGSERRFLTAWNMGLGYRSLYTNTMGWGANVFFDYSRSSFRNTYLQGGVGAEVFGNCWIGRINGYIPNITSQSQFLEPSQSFVVGTNIFNVDRVKRESSYGGFDLEAGYMKPFCYGEAWAYAAYYYYGTNKGKDVQGPRLRAEVRLFNPQMMLGPQVVVGGQWSYDGLHENQGSAYLSLRIPLGDPGCKRCIRPVCRRLYDPVYRNKSVWVEREVVREVRRDPRQIFFIDANTGGTGTQENPLSFGGGPIATGQPGDILFLVQNAVADVITGPVNLQDNQQLWGFGDNDFALVNLGPDRFLRVNRVGPTNVPNLQYRPQLQAPGMNGVVLANNNTISGIDIGPADNGVFGNGANNARINDVFIIDASTRGIDVTGGRDLNITNATILLGGGATEGIFVNDVDGTININENVVRGPDQGAADTLIAVNKTMGNAVVNLDTNTVNTAATDGIAIGATGTATLTARLTNNFVNDVDNGIVIASGTNGGAIAATVQRNTVSAGPNGMTHAIVLAGGQTGAQDVYTVQVDRNQITGNPQGFPALTGSAVLFDNMASNGGVSNLSVTNNMADSVEGVTYDFQYNSGNPQAICTTFLMNTANTLNVVDMFNVALPGGATATVYPAANNDVAQSIRANNTLPAASTVNVGGNVTGGPPCPTP